MPGRIKSDSLAGCRRNAQVSVRIAGHARLCHDSDYPPSGQYSTALKNDEQQGPQLVRWSIQEIRRIATKMAQRRIQPARIIAWSLWRRTHQAAAQRAHLKSKMQL
jgi:hypothetical protein